jgi:predicted dehydrogenase
MRTGSGLGVAVVGLGFGEAFLPLYAAHPAVREVAIVEADAERLRRVGDRYGITARYTSLDPVLADARWDAVHVVTPVTTHVELSIRVLRAGRHCACAVPMARDIDGLRAVLEAERASGKRYMMMETSVYGRELRFVERLLRAGRMGDLTGYRGFHIQDLDGFPAHWQAYPPMQYLTHALSPILALTGDTVASVVAHGSGHLTPERQRGSENPFPMEVGLFRLRRSPVVPEVTMAFFQTARPYTEGFSVYGDAMSVEWPERMDGPLTIHEIEPLDPARPATGPGGRWSRTTLVEPEDDDISELPAELHRFLRPWTHEPVDGGAPITHHAGHGGSHPWLVHEFLSAIVEDRPARIDGRTAAAWTAPGIRAHESALRDGERMEVPDFGA